MEFLELKAELLQHMARARDGNGAG